MSIKIATFPALTLTSGTNSPCTSTAIAVTTLTIQAEDNNVGNIYVGDADVSSSNGLIVPPGGSIELDSSSLTAGKTEELYTNEVYVTTTNTGNKARIVAFRRRN